MNLYRVWHSINLCARRSAISRAKYIKKHQIFRSMGDNCMVMFRKIPLYPELISVGNNVWVASNVTFVTHDVIHQMLNNLSGEYRFSENIGCIDIKDNVFIGANTIILPNVEIGANTVIAAGSCVNKSLQGNGVYAGVPAKYICSLNEFIEKRKKAGDLVIKKEKETLSKETIENCWKRFEHNHVNS